MEKMRKIGFFAALLAAISLSGCKFDVSKTFDDTKLLIGVPKIQDGYPVGLSLYANGPGTGGWLILSVPQADLAPLDGQDGGAVFYDVSLWQAFSEARGVLSFGLWLHSPTACLQASTSALGGTVVSQNVDLEKPGVWFLSAAEKDGGVPYGWDPDSDTTYQACYKVIGGIL